MHETELHSKRNVNVTVGVLDFSVARLSWLILLSYNEQYNIVYKQIAACEPVHTLSVYCPELNLYNTLR